MTDTIAPGKQSQGRQKLFQVILLLIVALWTFPVLLQTISGGLDNSWRVALHRTTIEGLRYGREVILTYGPLGYLRFPILISRNLWLKSVVYTITNHLLFFFTLFLFIRKEKPDWKRWLYLVVIVFAGLRIIQTLLGVVAAQTIISLFILNYLYLNAEKPNSLLGILLGILHSILLYIKFSDGLSALFLLLPFILLLLFEKRVRGVFVILTGYLSAVVILGLLLIGPPGDVALFFYNSFQIADGYINSTAKDGPMWQVYVALLSWVVYLGFMSYALFKRDSPRIKYLFLAVGLLFVSFKHGFVRHDLHVLNFFFIWTMVFTLYYLITSSGKSFLKQVALLFSLVLFFAFGASGSFHVSMISPSILLEKLHDIKMSIHMIADENFMNSQAVNERKLYESYSLKAKTYQLISGHTVDFFPWDISIAEQYGLRWIPRPLFQSYFAFTEYLDLLNKRHFSSNHSPEFILYSFKSIDGRYPLFDEPATFSTLLKRYQPVSIDGEFIVLRKKGTYEEPREHTVLTSVGKIGVGIPIPKDTDGYLFGRIYIDSNIWWKIAKLFYKPPQVYIQFVVDGNITQPYRFLPSNATNGVSLSQFISNQKDLFDLWDGKLTKNLDAIVFSVQNVHCFKEQVRVEFFTIPIN